ncbi:MAG: ABC transporter permease [Bryobacteraceae bacterium]|jgi:predicted permease
MASFNGLRHVLRRLRRAPMFTAVTLLTLAAGVGANTAIFSVLEGVLLKPLPYPRADRLVGVWHTAPGIGIAELAASPSTYFIYREQGRVFEDIGLYTGNSVSVSSDAHPERVQGLLVTDGVLPLLGVEPLMGRRFTRQDDSPGGSPETVMLGYGYWQRKFGGDRSIVGRTLRIDGKPRQIVGVLPASFHFLGREDPPLLLPFRLDRNKTLLGNFSYLALARLRPGATLAQANADVARMLPIVNISFPAPKGFGLKMFEQARIGPNLRPLRQDVIGDVGNSLWVVMATLSMVLLIACANVANLLLVRAEGRQQELAIRAALGAGWRRIAGELWLESLTLGLAGGALGLGLAYLGIRAFVASAPLSLPRLNEVGIDLPVFAFALLISLAAGLLLGAIPVFKYAGAHLGTGLREGGRTLGQSHERHRARSVLVVVQVALALVLLVSSGLMLRTFHALNQVEPGFANAAEVQTLRLTITDADVPDPERVVRLEDAIGHQLQALPGVSSVALSSSIPMDGDGSFDPIFAENRSYAEGQLPPVRRFKFVSPDYFKTLGTPLAAGRDFTWTDLYQRMPVVIVSENLAREYWHDARGALGKRIRLGTNEEWRQIVGVAGDLRDDGVNKAAPSAVYWPIMMHNFYGDGTFVQRNVAFAIRTSRAGSESFLKEVRQRIWSLDPNLPVSGVRTLDDLYRKSMARTAFVLVMLAAAGGMALLLGVVGIYGVIAYSVSQRTREIGIRVALGAQRQEVTGMFVRQGVILTGIGVACGLAAATVLMRVLAPLLFEVRPVDPLTYAAVSIGLIATACAASYLPSRRASAIDPSLALRAE